MSNMFSKPQAIENGLDNVAANGGGVGAGHDED